MQKDPIDRDTFETEASNQLQDTAQPTMTPDERKLYLQGLYFPRKVICYAEAAHKLTCSKWSEFFPIHLTTEAIGETPLTQITKVKLMRAGTPEKLMLKITGKQIHLYLINRKNAIQLFNALVWSKLATLNLFSQIQQNYESELHGEIYRKSQFFKLWEKNQAKFSKNQQFQLFRKCKECSVTRVESTTEVWTRFDTIERDSYLIVKLWRGIRKQQLGVPIERAMEWIQALCLLIQ